MWAVAAAWAIVGCESGDGPSAPEGDTELGSTSGEEGSSSGPASGGSSGTEDTTGGPGGSDASTAEPEGSSGDDGSTGSQDDGLPAFVALGDGGWFATSCDGGRSWTHVAFSDVIDDHSPWTAFGGLAYGDGHFVAGLGWGAPGRLMMSDDAMTWEELPSTAFVVDGSPAAYDAWTAAVAHTSDGFFAFSQTIWTAAEPGTWSPAGITLPPGSDQIRQLRGFEDGRIIAALESQAGEGHPVGNFVAISADRGQSWSEGAGFDESCAVPIQHGGDIEARGDTILVGANALCGSADGGQTWSVVSVPTGGAVTDLFDDGADFYALSDGRVLRSSDGASWTEVADLGAQVQVGGTSNGRYVAVAPRGDQFWYSDDGTSWQPGEPDWTPAGLTWVRDLAVGVPAKSCD